MHTLTYLVLPAAFQKVVNAKVCVLGNFWFLWLI